ncbi:MAG: hypothetical protein J3K34DRAFT_429438, partial [Monoraphidium minutum]
MRARGGGVRRAEDDVCSCRRAVRIRAPGGRPRRPGAAQGGRACGGAGSAEGHAPAAPAAARTPAARRARAGRALAAPRSPCTGAPRCGRRRRGRLAAGGAGAPAGSRQILTCGVQSPPGQVQAGAAGRGMRRPRRRLRRQSSVGGDECAGAGKVRAKTSSTPLGGRGALRRGARPMAARPRGAHAP